MADLEQIAEAAREYVAARLANEAASVDSWSVALARVDSAWHQLVSLCSRAVSADQLTIDA